MNRDFRFWALMLVFQVGFGFAVYAITRDYYVQEPANASPHGLPSSGVSSAWPNGIAANELARMTSPQPNQAVITDPVEISRQADVFFSNRQYEQAAEMYERLLTLSPDNPEIYNNLGLTLHYMGKSTEALRRLEQGVALNPDHQRIWLTIGYVNSELGNFDRARTALTNATLIGDNDSIRQSAQEMLDKLP
jgi:tetratricopeptide (TPR) repeat protein